MHGNDPTYGPTKYAVDIGNPQVQARFAQTALQIARSEGFDGIYLDNVSYSPLWDLSGFPQPYDTNAKWHAAYSPFLTYLYNQASAAGLQVIGNFGGSNWNVQPYLTWTAKLTGGLEENAFYDAYGAYVGPEAWVGQVQSLVAADVNDRIYLAQSRTGISNPQTRRFALASYLLGESDMSCFNWQDALYNRPYYHQDIEADIGSPTGAASEDSQGAWTRDFTNGVVYANPSPTASVVLDFVEPYFDLDGKQYIGRVTLPPVSGLVLTVP